MTARLLIVFDVNETLLDLETMEPTFQRIFGEKSAMRLWFANLILYSGADSGRLLRPIHRYRLGCHENAGGYAWHQNW
jgi:hypothetical protein